jgi:hypothetical protein
MAVTVDGEKVTDELEPFDPLLAPGAPAPGPPAPTVTVYDVEAFTDCPEPVTKPPAPAPPPPSYPPPPPPATIK